MTDALAPNRILRLRDVLTYTGLSRSTVYRRMQEGSFPKSIQIGTRCMGWRQSAIDAWLTDPMNYRRGASADHR